jgi:hypothetical protein
MENSHKLAFMNKLIYISSFIFSELGTYAQRFIF